MKKKRNLVVFPLKLCQLVPNDGTHQDKYIAAIDAHNLVPVDNIAVIHPDIQAIMAGNGIEWKFDTCWSSACIIHILDPKDITLVKLHWGNDGVIFKEE